MITWVQRRGQIKYILYQMCLQGRVDKTTLKEQFEALNEAEPIKHGQWLSVKVMDDEADFGETDGAECSVCGYTTNSEYWAKTYYHYCPNCGARMDAQIGEDKSHPFAESVMMRMDGEENG